LRDCALREQCARREPGCLETVDYTHRRTGRDNRFKAKMKTEEAQKIYAQRSQVAEFAHAWIKERLRLATIPLPGSAQSHDGGHLGVPELQPNALVRSPARTASSDCGDRVSEQRYYLNRNGDGCRRKNRADLAVLPQRHGRNSLQKSISSHVPVPDSPIPF